MCEDTSEEGGIQTLAYISITASWNKYVRNTYLLSYIVFFFLHRADFSNHSIPVQLIVAMR